ncbi:Cullin-domain-containing protein [Histomonas meleagridis]|uniref:Cullin-domain-containing protein n=1 Tax=Histomonas meleagridis TaxID=135588 RepID=UPI003559D17F|nr:Cullin-domain-containing protein [Histomonas meleagridis]KAH0798778.1 Cullin-domain-containing protein [Histomonas meleagridis]
MTNQIYPKIQAVFTKYKSLDINLYPKIIPVLSHIVNSLESTSAKEFVCKSFYEIGIQPNLDKIKSIIFSYHGNDLFLKTPPPSEALLLSALSFYPTDSTKKIIIEIFNNTIKSFIVPLEKELIIRNLALKMLQLLQIQENFLNLLNDVTFRKVTNKVLSELLNKAKFSAKFGEKYPIALSYIVDTYLKRGNAFKSKVTQSNISRLLSLVYERDLFVSVHTCNLFYRIVTRSTIGISYEAKFLDSIAAVVLDENLKEARQIIDETRICTEPTLPNFSYIFTCLSFKPNKNFSNKFLLPREYNSLVGSATNLISKRFPSKKIEWSHYFATTEMRLKTTAGVSDLITSIPQYDILHLFEENGNLQIPINSLIDTIGITKSHLESVLKTLVSSKILLLTKKENGDQIISFNMNFQQKKAMIADNWSPKAVKPKNNDVSRFICVKAAVVRIMKANRMMNIRQLIDKTINDIACLFPTSTDEVKRSIDVLVEDGYLERKGDTHLAYIE